MGNDSSPPAPAAPEKRVETEQPEATTTTTTPEQGGGEPEQQTAPSKKKRAKFMNATTLRTLHEAPRQGCYWLFEGTMRLFWTVGFFMTFCVVWIVIRTFSPAPVGAVSRDCDCEPPLEQCICARETIEALTPFELFCLANSRISAYMCYPLYLLMFLSMARNLRTWLMHTILAEFIPLTSAHHLHNWAGTMIGIFITWHGLWHLIRWGVQDNLHFLFQHQTGLTGFISLVITPFLVWPMRLAWLRHKIAFEVRKKLHYLSWVWALSIMFHAPAMNIFWIIGSAFVTYVVDWIYGAFVSTHLVASARFVRLESAVMIRLRKPEGFTLKGSGGYCYIMVPWLSEKQYEWHAFSIYKDAFDPDYVCFCIANAGDWTKQLHDDIHEPVYRRLWVNGPFASPFETAIANDNIISIASGVGITPALSVIKSLEETRKMHLIWMCRDAGLLEFFLDYGLALDDDAYTFIFYTGKRELCFRRELPYNVFLFKGRPDLHKLIVSLINSIEQDGAPALAMHRERQAESEDVESHDVIEQHFYAEINRLLLTYSVDELFNAAVRRSHLNARKVSFEGLRELMHGVFIRKFSDEQLKKLFDRADANNTGAIEFGEFEDFIQQLESEKDSYDEKRGARPELTLDELGLASADDDTEITRPYHWRMLYCGGSQVVKVLEGVSKKHDIPLSLESFDW